MASEIMDHIISEVRRRYGYDRWPSDVEQKVAEIEDLLRIIFR
jgi:hypothetical protein